MLNPVLYQKLYDYGMNLGVVASISKITGYSKPRTIVIMSLIEDTPDYLLNAFKEQINSDAYELLSLLMPLAKQYIVAKVGKFIDPEFNYVSYTAIRFIAQIGIGFTNSILEIKGRENREDEMTRKYGPLANICWGNQTEGDSIFEYIETGRLK